MTNAVAFAVGQSLLTEEISHLLFSLQKHQTASTILQELDLESRLKTIKSFVSDLNPCPTLPVVTSINQVKETVDEIHHVLKKIKEDNSSWWWPSRTIDSNLKEIKMLSERLNRRFDLLLRIVQICNEKKTTTN